MTTILLGFSEEFLHIINVIFIVYLIKGCEFIIDYRKLAGAGTLLLLSLVMYEIYKTTGMTLILNLALIFLIFMMVVQLDTKSKIVYFVMTYFIEVFFVRIIKHMTVALESGDKYFNFVDVLNEMVIFCILAFLVSMKIRRAKIKVFENTNLYIQIYLTIGLMLGAFMLVGIDLFKEAISFKLYIVLLILAVLTPITNVFMYVFCIKKYVENARYKADIKTLEVQNIYFKEMIGSYEDLKQFRHDVNGYYNTINKLIEEEKYDEVYALTDNLKQAVNTNVLRNCNNTYISATINQFLNVMERESVEFLFEYEVNEEIIIKNMHLCSLFYNLLSNAIEATLNCDQPKFVQLTICAHNNALIIKLVNSVDSSFDIHAMKVGNTSKADSKNHGIGLFIIQQIIELYHGHIYKEVNDNKLHTEIVLLDAIII